MLEIGRILATKQHRQDSITQQLRLCISEMDTDKDSLPDCNDKCPMDAEETETGTCSFGVADNSTVKDSALNCNDDARRTQ